MAEGACEEGWVRRRVVGDDTRKIIRVGLGVMGYRCLWEDSTRQDNGMFPL